MAIKAETVIARYIETRDKKAELSKEWEAKKAVLDQALEKMEVWLMKKADEEGLESLKTTAGVAYKEIETKAACENWANFWPWAIANKRVDMLQKRLLASAILEYKEEVGDLPPGIVLHTERVMRVRRS